MRFYSRRVAGPPTVLPVFIKGRRVSLSTTVDITHWDRVEWGEGVYIWHHAILDSYNGISIGRYSQIGTKVGIFTHSSHISIRLMGCRQGQVPFSEHTGRIKGKVEIGDFSFVGANAVIMPQTVIGRGSIVSAFSYVAGTFPEFSVIAGNPAQRVADSRILDRWYLRRHPELNSEYKENFGEIPKEL
jgi:acetyltransferase-like isoleucine patch superfamily enzyme